MTVLPEYDTLTAAEVAAYFRVDPKTVHRWLIRGWVAGSKTPGGDWRISRAELVDLPSGGPDAEN